MFEVIYNAEATPGLRRIHLSLRSSATDAPINPVLTGVKPWLSLNGAAGAAATNDLVAVSAANMPGAHYLELTLAELIAFVSGNLIGSIQGLAGTKVEDFQATIVAYNPWSSSPPDVNLVSAVGHTLAGDGTTTPIHA